MKSFKKASSVTVKIKSSILRMKMESGDGQLKTEVENIKS